jgi:Protein of unknown function (DUF4236)
VRKKYKSINSINLMAWSFRKRIKIIPGVYLNFSKSGISTSIGVKGASLTFSKSGTYLNTSISGLGLSNRQKISDGYNQPQPRPNEFQYLSELPENIFSADIQEITSQDMQGIKETILAAREERKNLRNDIVKVKTALTTSKVKLISSYALIYGLIKKSIPVSIKEDIKSQKEVLSGLRDCLENCFVKIDIDFDPEIREKYNKVVESYKKLTISKKIWDVTSAHSENRVQTRSAASTVVQKKEVKFGFQNLAEIKTNFPALYLQNANGGDLYFYPSFIVMYKNKESFALIGYNELDFYFSSTRFVEEGSVPSDTKTIDRTWKKVNKNGAPDKRFKGNYQIPIVRYGTINLRTNTGINEEYSFSNYELSEEFSRNFTDYQLTIKHLQQL